MQLGLVGARRLMLVCKVARGGAKDFLATLPGFLVSGGSKDNGFVNEVWRLDLVRMRWEAMPALVHARINHACCVVEGSLVVSGGSTSQGIVGSVEMLAEGGGQFTSQPPLSCGDIRGAAAIALDTNSGAAGQMLLLGGGSPANGPVPTVNLVDLATGVCTEQSTLIHARCQFAAARLHNGGFVCAGGSSGANMDSWSAELLQPPPPGLLGAAWTQRVLPAMSVGRAGCRGCVLSDGRFTVLGGRNSNNETLSSCEALTVGADEHWALLPSMHDARSFFACAAVAKCIVVAGGDCPTQNGWGRLRSAEVFDEVLARWLRLPHLPIYGGLTGMGTALL